MQHWLPGHDGDFLVSPDWFLLSNNDRVVGVLHNFDLGRYDGATGGVGPYSQNKENPGFLVPCDGQFFTSI